uniref:SH3 domain-binding protein 5 n=1 Tax=Mola mola TaxID=94237 RepID=A0A3Q3W4K7_MOLML
MDHLEKEHRSDDDAEYEDEEVDPRIQGELEKLNQSTDDINRCETELEDARQKFRSILVEATVKLDELVKKIGKAVEDSKPYWEARRLARQAQLEAQKATQDFQRATEVLRAAKETISLAEQRLLEEDNRQFDSAWQEMLNHATQRVMEAEHTKTKSELVHKETAAKYTANLKKNVDKKQAKMFQAKGEYKTALRNLEMISDEIHERRLNSTIGPRGRGVGAEGDGVPGDDISSFKLELDGISLTSACFDDEACGGGSSSIMSEDNSETHSTCSIPSSPSSSCCTSTSASPSPTPFSSSSSPSPLSSPCSLDLPNTVSLSDFGLISPVLGPRSECSGASSPECDLERGDRAEGAERDLDNASTTNNNSSSTSSTKRSSSLETRFSFLNLRRPRAVNAKNTDSCSQKVEAGQTVVLVK